MVDPLISKIGNLLARVVETPPGSAALYEATLYQIIGQDEQGQTIVAERGRAQGMSADQALGKLDIKTEGKS